MNRPSSQRSRSPWPRAARFALALGALGALLTGCGGGGGGPSAPASTGTGNGNGTGTGNGNGGGAGGGSQSGTLLIELRDPTGAPVDGIVTVGTAQRATFAGNVTFANVAAGQQTVAVLVNGVASSTSVAVANGATTTDVVPVSFAPGTTGTPLSPPVAPFALPRSKGR